MRAPEAVVLYWRGGASGILMVEPSLEFIAERLERLQTEFRAFRHLSSDVAQLRADLLRVQENLSDLRLSHDALRESHDALREYVLELRMHIDAGFAATTITSRRSRRSSTRWRGRWRPTSKSSSPKSAARHRDQVRVFSPSRQCRVDSGSRSRRSVAAANGVLSATPWMRRTASERHDAADRLA